MDSGVNQPSLESTRFLVVLKRDQKVDGEVNFAGDEVYVSEELNTTCIIDGALRRLFGLTDYYLNRVHRNDDSDVMLPSTFSVG